MNYCHSRGLFKTSTNGNCHWYNAVMAFHLTVITIKQTDRQTGHGVTCPMYVSPECNVVKWKYLSNLCGSHGNE